MAFLEIRDLSYTYPNSGVRAVDGLDLNAERGELIAMIGPNAAGKSTFARLLKGLIKSDSGSVRITGAQQPADGPDPGIGILFSNPENQLVTSIVEEDVAFGLEVLCTPARVIEEKVDAVLAHLGITHLRRRMPHLMSGGEQQMSALAGVLVLDPEILVLDEPTAYLDPEARLSVMTSMRHLAEQGKVIIWITHDMKEAASADRVILMDRGRVAMQGVPEEIFNRPGISERYGIFPPFLLKLVLGMRSLGLKTRWPVDPAALAEDLAAYLGDCQNTYSKRTAQPRTSLNGRSVLTFEAVRFSYGPETSRTLPVLNGVDFSVQEGCISLICGANGSGKSTLLQLSNGLVNPDSGRVLLDGRQINQWKKKRYGISSRVALLFQNPERQLFSATVFDDIAFGPLNMAVPADRIKGRVLKAIKWVGLSEDVLERSVHSLSGGQMRRVAVAGVLAMEPELLVLDEPTDGLDPGGGREFFRSARRYCEETGTAIFMATHEIPEQVGCIDHVGYLVNGRVHSSGPPSEVLTLPARKLPKQFLPDHLVLREGLLKSGLAHTVPMLDADMALEQILDLARRKSQENKI
jgi:energy-coupling factor transport system ATP-binding protein